MDSTFENGKFQQLKQMLSSYANGQCPVTVEFTNECATARLRLSDEWRVAISDGLLEQLHAQFGDGVVAIEYH
jgi:hypothetical protein